MGDQIQGTIGRMVDGMIRRSVRRGFHGVYWQPPAQPVSEPSVFVANHHGWHDGYLLYLALSSLKLNGFNDWIQEFDSFPLFAKVGGMPFPADDPARRAATIRRTIRLMREERHSLMLFAEGVLHRPPELLPFGKSLETVVKGVPDAKVVPVGIRYELSMHERPEAFLLFGDRVEPGPDLCRRTRLAVAALLDRTAVHLAVDRERFRLLHEGTKDVNERLDIRKMPGITRWTQLSGKSRPPKPRSD